MKFIRIISVLTVVVFILSGCSAKLNEAIVPTDVVSFGAMQNDISSTEYELIAENEKLEFWFNTNTTAFKLVDKRDGFEWYSTADSVQTKSENNAPFKLSYVNESGLVETMDAMNASIAAGQYGFEKTIDGLRITYSLGEYELELMIPLAMSAERKQFIMDNIEGDFIKSQFDNMYQFVELEKLNEENQKKFSALYPKLNETPLYVLRENIVASDDKMKELAKLLEEAGYTAEMYEEDSENFVDSGEESEETPCFRVQLVYQLTENGLKVTVPASEIQMSASFPMLELELLKYFGSPKNGDSGYFLLPDGSGSLMNFYNGRGHLQEYSVDVYGLDYSAAQSEYIYQCDQAYLPVYGIKNGDHAVFVQIEKGDAIATINAYPGSEQLGAYAYAKFRLRSYTKSYVNNTANHSESNYFVSLQNKRYNDDIVMNYTVMSGDNADYKGMAAHYRSVLFGDGASAEPTAPALLVECIGQIEKSDSVLGISTEKKVAMTTFNRVGEIADSLKQIGVDRLNIKLSGWFNGGYHNRYAGKLSVEKSLGGRDGLIQLSEKLKNNNIGFYPDADMLYTYKTGWFDQFRSTKDSVTLVSKAKGYKIEYNPATFCRDADYMTPVFINNPTAITRAFDEFFKKYDALGINGISLRNVGSNLNGDYDDKNGTDRQAVKEIITESLAKTAERHSVMTNGVNAYALSHTDYCSSVPLWSTERDNTNETVPFVQMVLSGNIGYSGPAVNLEGDSKDCILKMALVAADAYYIVSAENYNEVRNTEFSFLYCSDFEHVKTEISELALKYCRDMEGISGQRITDFEKLDTELYRTTFEDGSTVTVNLSTKDKTVDSNVFAAKSYTVKRGGTAE